MSIIAEYTSPSVVCNRCPNETRLGFLDVLCLGDDGDPAFVVAFGVGKGRVNDALRALGGDDPEVYGQIVGNVNTLAAHGVEVLGVLPKEGPVYAFLGYAYRADVGEEIQGLAHGNVGAF